MPAPSTVSIRPAAREELRLAADLETRARPYEPEDPPALAHWAAHPRLGAFELLLVVRDGTPIGVSTLEHAVGEAWEPERVTSFRLSLVPDGEDATADALRLVEERAAAGGARRLDAWSTDRDAQLNPALAAAGYEHVRTGQAQELDLVANRSRLLAGRDASRAAMTAAGIQVRTAAGEPRDQVVEQLRHLVNTTEHDVPHTVEEPDMDAAGFQALLGPGVHFDRLWTAWDGDELVAESHLEYPEERGNVWTGFTCCLRSHRGRGIAQAVKNETVGQAIELDIPRIRTDNDSENAPMLAINRKLGYTPIYELWEWLRTLD